MVEASVVEIGFQRIISQRQIIPRVFELLFLLEPASNFRAVFFRE